MENIRAYIATNKAKVVKVQVPIKNFNIDLEGMHLSKWEIDETFENEQITSPVQIKEGFKYVDNDKQSVTDSPYKRHI